MVYSVKENPLALAADRFSLSPALKVSKNSLSNKKNKCVTVKELGNDVQFDRN